MKGLIPILVVAAIAFGGARAARTAAVDMRSVHEGALGTPYTPSADLAPLLSLGYREALADLLYVRLRGYFGEYIGTAGPAIVSLGEAIVALDPMFYGAYGYTANAVTIAEQGVDQSAVLRAVALLEEGIKRFPEDWRLAQLAGQMYIQDLATDDVAQYRAWQERGLLLVESALRKPGAPQQSALWAAALRTRLGQHQRAVEGLREMLLVTPDGEARKRMIDALATLEEQDSAAIALEIHEMREQFEAEWRTKRRSLPPTMFVLVGPRLEPGFHMTDLATGGRDLLIGIEKVEPLE